ncbi:MAG: glycosyl transferase family 2, partial [Firmicutes bacterium]|nr:glycosyl transferase family 2 [Bacillota bacterium]
MKLISIVVPVFNEEENIQVFYQEVCKYMEPLPYCF